jgi:hypothetical protein
MRKKNLPPATVKENRVGIFEPTSKANVKERTIQVRGGTVKVKGRLGQTHKDLLELIRYTALDWKKTTDGRIAVLVDPYILRKNMGKSCYSYSTIRKLLQDLVETTIEINTTDFVAFGAFIDVVVASKKVLCTKTHKERRLIKIEFGKLGTMLIEQDIQLQYDPRLIIPIKHGITKAVVRYIYSHKNQPAGGWKIDTVLHALGVTAPPAVWKARMYVKQEKDALARCGVIVTDDDRLVLQR